MLHKLLSGFRNRLKNAFSKKDKEEIEKILIEADVGVDTTLELCEKAGYNREILKEELKKILAGSEKKIVVNDKPYVIMVIGINGTGKTTTVAKLASFLKNNYQNILIISADTYRDAANEQLRIWAKRMRVPITESERGQDSGAVVYDGLNRAVSKKFDIVLIDTAGRMHTRKDLMCEILKIKKVCSKVVKNAPHLVLLVLDATTGQNGIVQAKEFLKFIKVDGVVITKMDGTAKGGIIIPVWRKLKIPVYFIGTGEAPQDLAVFSIEEYVNSIIDY